MYSGSGASKLSVFYTIRARVDDNNTSGTQFLPSIRGKRRMLVSQQACEHITNVSIHSGDVIKSMGVIDKGASAAHVTFEKSFYSQGEIAVVTCKLDNTNCE